MSPHSLALAARHSKLKGRCDVNSYDDKATGAAGAANDGERASRLPAADVGATATGAAGNHD
jgi:hypothetical protein